MPHIRIVYDIRGWAYHNRALALRKHAPPAFDVSLGACPLGEPVSSALGDQAPDLVFWLPQSRITAARACLIQRGWPSKLVASCNAGWPMRIREFYDAYDQSDFLVFNNKRYADGTGNPPGTTILTNGVDFEVFNVRIPIEARSPKVVWMGSSRYAHVKGLDLMLSVTAELEELG